MPVAPHVGAWIEIDSCGREMEAAHRVAPHVGAWIEMPTKKTRN